MPVEPLFYHVPPKDALALYEQMTAVDIDSYLGAVAVDPELVRVDNVMADNQPVM